MKPPAESRLLCTCTNPECPGASLLVEVAGDSVLLSVGPEGAEVVVDRRELADALGYDLALIPREDA